MVILREVDRMVRIYPKSMVRFMLLPMPLLRLKDEWINEV
jgi:hypothetical protein